MGLVEEAVKGGKEGEESERKGDRFIYDDSGHLGKPLTTQVRGIQLLKNTLLDFKSPKILRSKSQKCCLRKRGSGSEIKGIEAGDT